MTALEWLALNEAYHFINDAEDQFESGSTVTTVLANLTADLELVVWALCTCATLDSQITTGRPFRLINAAAVHARISVERLGSEGAAAVAELQRLADRIIALWTDYPACAPLPTVNPTPLCPN